jgi:hypothetical protein
MFSRNISLLTLVFGLISCGGGGGGGGSSSSVSIPNITVATGAAVEGATVSVVDSKGATETCAGVTNSNGQISCTLSTATSPPYFIRAQKLTSTFYAVLPATSSVVNITPVSTAMAKKFANDNGLEAEQIVSQPSSMSGKTSASAQAAVDLVNAIVKVVALQTAGLTIDNALTQSYTATTNDKLDKFIHNMNISTDSTGINISIPTNAGTVSVNVAYTAAVAAATATATSGTNGVTANMTDATAMDTVMTNFLSYLNSCSAQDKANMKALVYARIYPNGDKYFEGQTLDGWVNNICSKEFGTLTKTYTKSIARYGNRGLVQYGIKNVAGNEFETIFSFIKDGGTWKLMSDNLPVNHSFKTRHSLGYEFSDSDSVGKFRYERYLDTWIDDEKIVTAAAPDRPMLYAVPLKQVAEKYNDYVGFASATPIMTIYKTTNCGSHLYVLDSNRSDCNSFAPDTDNASLFSMLEGNDYTMLLIKTVNAAGACLNCDGNGMPESGAVLGKAYSFTQIFGTSQTETSLRTGIPASSLSSDLETRARVYFAAPTKTQLTNLSTLFKTTSPGKTVNIPWTRATKDNQQIDGFWAGYNPCGLNTNWANFPEVSTPNLGTTNSWDFVYPVDGKTYQNAGYLSFTLPNRVNESEFAFYIRISRWKTCTI